MTQQWKTKRVVAAEIINRGYSLLLVNKGTSKLKRSKIKIKKILPLTLASNWNQRLEGEVRTKQPIKGGKLQRVTALFHVYKNQ